MDGVREESQRADMVAAHRSHVSGGSYREREPREMGSPLGVVRYTRLVFVCRKNDLLLKIPADPKVLLNPKEMAEFLFGIDELFGNEKRQASGNGLESIGMRKRTKLPLSLKQEFGGCRALDKREARP